MFIVIFEVRPRKARFDEYLSIAKALRPHIEKIDGFIDNERYGSKDQEGRILSLSTWRDEKALIRWRTLAIHHHAQEKGRIEIFEDYHLRVGEIVSDTAPPAGHVVREQRLDETEVGAARLVTVSELAARNAEPATADVARDLGLPVGTSSSLVDHEVFESLSHAGKLVLLASWGNAAAWQPEAIAGDGLRHRRVRIIRDYGMFDRREATQYYAPVDSKSAGARRDESAARRGG